MSASCTGPGCASGDATSPRYRRVLWIALAVNALMFLVEIIGGVTAGSSSLQADALDFLGDAANYGISLFVLAAALTVRARLDAHGRNFPQRRLEHALRLDLHATRLA